MKSKKIIYTCITGGYDDLRNHSFINSEWDYVCFTDNVNIKNIENSIWEIRQIKFSEMDDIRNQRWHKLHPHILFPEYEESLWVDANIDIINDGVFGDIDKIKKENGIIAISKHPERNCLYDELEACIKYSKDNEMLMKKQIELIEKDNFPKNYGLFETSVIYRKHNNPGIIKAMEDWWFWVKNYSRRDQLSLTYVIWKNGIKINPLNDKPYRGSGLNRIKCFYGVNHVTKEELMGEIINLKNKIVDLNGYVQDKDLEIQQKGQEIQTKEEEIQLINQEIKNKDQLIQSKVQEIIALRNSYSWKITKPIRFIKDRMLKTKNLILSFLRLCKKALIILKRDGLRVFLKKGFKYFKHKKEYSNDYNLWIKQNENFDIFVIKKEINNFKYKPRISIITPVYNVDSKWLDKCIQSVRSQFYENWELCLYDDASTKKETIECLKKWEKLDSRIKISYGKVNQHISGASNEALKLVTGEFVALLDNDDELAPHALFENVKLLNEHPNADFIYSDEDKLELDGTRVDPFFKPDWSPDLFLSMMYTCHLGVYRKSIIDKIGGFRKGYEGSQDYDLVLRFIENTVPDNIYHISKILYHWRKIPGSTSDKPDAKNYAYVAAKKALSDYLDRHNIEGKVLDGEFTGGYRIKRKIIKNDKVSIIIPFKDQVEILKKCVDSIKQKTNYTNYELILVNNQSMELDTLNYIKSLEKIKNISILQYNEMFNFSAINNLAVKKANGKYILFLNNDTEVINSDWLSSMVEHIQRDEVGAVGVKLIYPNNTIQHAGIVMGLGIASHAFRNFPRESHGYFGLLNDIRNCSAITGACMMVKKKTFLELNGFNEKDLSIAYNDVDLCLRIREKDYLIVYTPYAQLYHCESLSRGNDEDFKFTNPEKYKRVLAEKEYIQNKWKEIIENDPYYNPNLTRTSENFGIRVD